MEHEFLLSGLEEAEICAMLKQLTNRELRILSRIHCAPEFPIDSERIAFQLSRNMNFTLTTKVTLTYNQ